MLSYTNPPCRIPQAIADLERMMVDQGESVHSTYWQALDVSDQPAAEMRELQFINLVLIVPARRSNLSTECQPNVPWAEEHFQERIAGDPVNPGVTWLNWPWSNAANKHRKDGQKFSHNYMERYWPKEAGASDRRPHMGIRFPYGDLTDVVELIVKDPLTRQAYMPVFFPEDTGAVHGERVPCSIGYHFMIRDDLLHCVYQLRSCDLYRHFRDDIYLTARLMHWVQEELSNRGVHVSLGHLHVHISSLHLFINDYHALAKRLPA